MKYKPNKSKRHYDVEVAVVATPEFQVEAVTYICQIHKVNRNR